MPNTSRKFWPLIVIPAAILGACAGRYYLTRAPKAPPAQPLVAVKHATPAPAATLPDDVDPPSPYATYSQVEDGLYVGGRVAKPPEGTRAVVNLSFNKDVYTVEDNDWQPIGDGGKAPSLEWLNKQVQFIDKERKAGHTTYVHCDAGISRGPTVTLAYLMYHHHWTRDKAIEFLKTRRPIISPNIYFMDMLLDWEDQLKNPPASAPATAP